ncbi:MAG TPA: TonB-dependent receptor plug domain-containing protein [Thermoanaerobaculia bacterium]|nr:TonB-dependent receptor plug domain-containing protein [Thermoanaerobaculia bacterium]
MHAFLLFLIAVQSAEKPVLAESIVVAGIRADAETPVTKTDLKRADIEKNYYGQDIPMLLRDTPSIAAYAEGGVGGAGYSYITMRGISSTRINFTLDGVPLADSEDMATYFVDFPDLAHSLDSIQVQRGAGTSTVGAGAFGGSVNLESVPLATASSTDLWLGGGSFGTGLASVGYQSGSLPGGFALYGRLSLQRTNGFREHSGTRQHNIFLSAAKQNATSQLKLTGFAAHEYQQNSYFAADADTLRTDLRANPMSPEDRDSFGYNFAQLQYMRSNMTASAFFQRGYGWYRLDDAQYGLDGLLMGTMLTYSTPHANYGVHFNEFRREHTRDLIGGARDYYNYGTKGEANAFAKFTWDTQRWHLYSDNQVRTTDFHYHGDVAIDPVRWTFFNPKIGARFGNFYASAGIARREPTRTDLFQGQDNATFAHDLHAVHPERLIDLEAGWDLHTVRGYISSNIYMMNFRNEIAATGQLSDIGLPLRRNVDRSYRRGIEVNGSWQIAAALRWRGNANVSRNRIHQWTQFYDVYDAKGNIVGSRPVSYFNVNPILTPDLIVNQALEYAPSPRWSAGAVARYVGKAYLDNTNNNAFTTSSFVVVDGTASVSVTRSTQLSLQINNLLNRRRVFPSGYSYLFFTPAGAIDGISYFYPQATRNAIVTLHMNL